MRSVPPKGKPSHQQRAVPSTASAEPLSLDFPGQRDLNARSLNDLLFLLSLFFLGGDPPPFGFSLSGMLDYLAVRQPHHFSDAAPLGI
ncbi:hypothetical protein LZ32DRAFT_454253 [Colletotrichum eremochloae]|nr:hypothetical protein LZ32DRAFT_454253 [Colletotrichum eremochloae]